MSDIESRVSEILAEKYRSHDAPHEIMDNPIFNQLPLSTRVAVLEKNRDVLGSPRPTSGASVSNMLAWGGVAGATSMLATAFFNRKSLPVAAYALAAGTGATLGAAVPWMAHRKNVKRDNAAAEDILENRYLEALAQRSMSAKTPVPAAVDPKVLLGKLNQNILDKIYNSYK